MYAALGFIRHVNPDYKTLLENKDPVALLLLALWYSSVEKAVWWIERRAAVEGRAICLYLERYHGDESAIMEILPWRSPVCYKDVWLPERGLVDWGSEGESVELAMW